MVFAALAAGVARLAKATPLARTEFSRALIGQQRFGPHLCFRPANELLCRDLVGRGVGQPGLHDGHAHGVNVVQRIELQQRAEAVQHQLAVPIRIHPDAPAALEVDHLDGPIRDDDQIPCAKALRDVGDLYLTALGHARRNDVLSNPARRVSTRAIHLGRILAGKRASADVSRRSVLIDRQFAPGKAGIRSSPAQHKGPGGIDQDSGIACQQLTGNHLAQHFPANKALHVFPVDLSTVLERNDHRRN